MEAEHALLVRLFGCIEAYRRLPDEQILEEPVFVPIRDFVVRIGYNDLSNVKQEVLLRSDKQSENVIHTVKSDPGDNQHVVSPYITMEAHIPDLSLQPVQDQTYTSLCSFPDNMAVKIDYSC